MGDARRVLVVTGANRGLGKETARQMAERGWQVVVGGRSLEKAEAAATEIGHGAVAVRLDVTSDAECAAAAAFVGERFGRVDCLVNNAGAVVESWETSGVLASPLGDVLETWQVNALGTLRVTRAFASLLQEAGGAIVNVSSGMGGITEMDGGHPGYRMSKASMNALTRMFHAEIEGVRSNSVCPGWVQTDMGGPNATRTVPEGAASIVWAIEATKDGGGPSGGFFRDGEPVPF